MGKAKYNHIPGNVYLTEWIDYDGNRCHCMHMVIQMTQGQTQKLSDQRYALFCMYSRRSVSGFSTTARWTGRAALNAIAKKSIDVTKHRLEVVLLFGTTLEKMLHKAFDRYNKHYNRYTTRLDRDLIQSLLPGGKQ